MYKTVNTIAAGMAFAQKSGFPVSVKGSFTLGTVVMVVENEEDLKKALAGVLQRSPIGEAKIDKVEHFTENPEDSVA